MCRVLQPASHSVRHGMKQWKFARGPVRMPNIDSGPGVASVSRIPSAVITLMNPRRA